MVNICPVKSYKYQLSKQRKCLLHGIHGSTEAYIFLSIRGKFILNSTLKVMYLCEDTDIPEQFLKALTYDEIILVGGSAKGRNNLNVNSSS